LMILLDVGIVNAALPFNKRRVGRRCATSSVWTPYRRSGQRHARPSGHRFRAASAGMLMIRPVLTAPAARTDERALPVRPDASAPFCPDASAPRLALSRTVARQRSPSVGPW
jgi:hypothetical protein